MLDNEAMIRAAPLTVSPAGHLPAGWGVLRFLREPFTRRSWAEFGYAMVGLPLAIVGFVFTIATLAIGALSAPSVAGLFVGLPALVASSYGVRYFGAVNRRMADRLIGLRVAAPPPLRPVPGIVGLVWSALTDVAAWRARAYLVLKLPIAVLNFSVAMVFRAGAIEYAASPLLWAVNANRTWSTITASSAIPFSITAASTLTPSPERSSWSPRAWQCGCSRRGYFGPCSP
ncbi:MAG: sensor domain-containing protein [Micromonosporaceae bacterium]